MDEQACLDMPKWKSTCMKRRELKRNKTLYHSPTRRLRNGAHDTFEDLDQGERKMGTGWMWQCPNLRVTDVKGEEHLPMMADEEHLPTMAEFCSMNTPTVAHFRLPIREH